jgi:hypothetical protein
MLKVLGPSLTACQKQGTAFRDQQCCGGGHRNSAGSQEGASNWNCLTQGSRGGTGRSSWLAVKPLNRMWAAGGVRHGRSWGIGVRP